MKYPTVEELERWFYIEDNKLMWKPREGKNNKTFNARYANKEVGHENQFGYRVCTFRGAVLYVHRVIYAIYNGEYPEFVDHANRDRADNSETNLRPADRSDNGANRVNTGRYARGVTYQSGRKKPWYASIKKHGTRYHLGTFETEAEAAAAYKMAARKLHKEFSAA